MKLTLSSNQAFALSQFADVTDVMMLNFPTGTGKTFVSPLLVKKAWFKSKRKLKTVFLCPPTLLFQVREEFISKGFQSKDILILYKHQTDKHDFLNCRHSIIILPDTCLVNYARLLEFNTEMLIVDESHRFKTHDSGRTKFLHSFITQAKGLRYKILMSGTLLTKSILDVWSQIYVLDKGDRLGKNYYVFKNTYTTETANNPNCRHATVLTYKENAVENIIEKLSSIMFTACELEVLKNVVTPKQTILKMKMNDEAQALYTETMQDMVVTLDKMVEDEDNNSVNTEGSTMKAMDHIATKLATLRQITNGFIYKNTSEYNDEEETFDISRKTYYTRDNTKIDILEKLLMKLVIKEKRKVLVWSVYQANSKCILKVCKKLGIKAVYFNSSLTPRARNKMVAEFSRTDDNSPYVFLSHPQCGGTGLNLQISNASIYYSLDNNWGTYKQSLGRNYRKGSEFHHRIDRFYLVMEKTVDEEVYNAIGSKTDFITGFMSKMISDARDRKQRR